MKLKLEIQDSLTILSVLETIDPPHLPVLKAGLNKLIQSGKRALVLDLMAIPEERLKGSPVIPELTALPGSVIDQDAVLVIASPVSGVGNAPTREEAIAQVTSPLNQLLLKEARLRSKLEQLQRQKAEADRRMSASVPEAEVRKLRRANSDLKRLIAVLETQAKELFQRRVEPTDPEASKARVDTVRRVLTAVLEQEGILPVT